MRTGVCSQIWCDPSARWRYYHDDHDFHGSSGIYVDMAYVNPMFPNGFVVQQLHDGGLLFGAATLHQVHGKGACVCDDFNFECDGMAIGIEISSFCQRPLITRKSLPATPVHPPADSRHDSLPLPGANGLSSRHDSLPLPDTAGQLGTHGDTPPDRHGQTLANAKVLVTKVSPTASEKMPEKMPAHDHQIVDNTRPRSASNNSPNHSPPSSPSRKKQKSQNTADNIEKRAQKNKENRC